MAVSDNNHADCYPHMYLDATNLLRGALGSIRPTSACVDYGTDPIPYTGPILSLEHRDQDGDPRPVNGIFDVGPDELP